MKYSTNLAKYYSSTNLDHQGAFEDFLGLLGKQLGAVEEAFYNGDTYQNIIVVKVKHVQKHPDADRLNICMIDDGGVTTDVDRDENGLIQVVCGAPNVRENILVAWVRPGAIVPETYFSDDQFTIQKRDIRGIASNGMLASAKELNISADHDGILIINPSEIKREITLGEDFKTLYGLDDYIIDFENKMFTHRPDCFGILGIAREIAAVQNRQFKSPDWYKVDDNLETITTSSELLISNDCPELVPRFTAVVLDNIIVKPSPLWMQALLSRLGLKSINNVVDLTNYYMYLTGQPLHAFDYHKLKGAEDQLSLGPRMAKNGEKLTILGGKEITLTNQDIVIATSKQAVALAGVMGGKETEVDNNTTKIIIECATFDMYNIRRTSMRHGIFTDASARYTKGQSSLQNLVVLKKITEDLIENYQAEHDQKYYDLYPKPISIQVISVPIQVINQRLGIDIDIQTAVNLLNNAELNCQAEGDSVIVRPPFWRMDLHIIEDIVEEVGRLYGYDKCHLQQPTRLATVAPRSKLISLSNSIRNYLSSFGANEISTYSFVNQKLLTDCNQNIEQAYHIRNAISPNLEYYRLSLTPSTLQKVAINSKSGHKIFGLYQIGKSVNKINTGQDSLPIEKSALSFVYCEADSIAKKYQHSAYYQSKYYLVELLKKLGLTDYAFVPLQDNIVDSNLTACYEPFRSALLTINGQIIGIVGEFKPDVSKKLKLPEYCSGFEIDLDLLSSISIKGKRVYNLSSFPKIDFDICLETTDIITQSQIIDSITASLSEEDAEVETQCIDIYQPADQNSKRSTYRVTIKPKSKTYQSEDISRLTNLVVSDMNLHFPAKQI